MRWSEIDHRIVIHQKGGLAARVFGLPFLIAAAYLVWHFLGGLLGFVDPSQGELTGAGLVMLPVAILAFGTPGFILVFGRKRTEVDGGARSAIEVRDLLVHRFETVTPIPADAAVRTYLEASQSSERTTTLLLVEIVSRKGETVQAAVLQPTEAASARELARDLAALLGARLVDDIDKGPMTPSWEEADDEVDEE